MDKSEEELKKITLESIEEINNLFQDEKETETPTSSNVVDEKAKSKIKTRTSIKDYIIASLLVTAIMLFFGWVVVNEVKYNNEQKNFFSLFTVLLVIYFGFIIIKTFDSNSKQENFTLKKILFFNPSIENLSFYILLLFLGVPLIGFLLLILLLITNNLYWLISIYLIATCVLFVKSTKKYFFKIIALLILASLLYTGFNSRNILKVNLTVVFNKENVLKQF